MEREEEKSDKPTQKTDRNIFLDNQLVYLSKEFKGQCKVLSGSGRFSKTVKLNPENFDLVINFQLTGKLLSKQVLFINHQTTAHNFLAGSGWSQAVCHGVCVWGGGGGDWGRWTNLIL